jgi:hypothetical protein
VLEQERLGLQHEVLVQVQRQELERVQEQL